MILRFLLIALCALLIPSKAYAQQFDLSFMGAQTPAVQPKVSTTMRANGYDLSSLGVEQRIGTLGNVSRPTLKQAYARPTNRAVLLDSAQTNILAQHSVDGYPIPSGRFDYGFPKTGPAMYRGVYSNVMSRTGGNLPQVSTSSVDINICDEGSLGSGGGDDGGGAGGGGGGGSQEPPALPPGWTGVMCHGVYAGAIPPGGTVEAFWRGEYGFAGDAAQQAALAEEGRWLLEHGQIGP